MKLLLACVVFLAALAWSSVNLVWTKFQFQKGYLEIDSAKICNVDTTYVNCTQDKGLAYYSTLDTSYIVFFNPLITKIELYKILSEDEMPLREDKLTKVLRYEFMKWQDWGIVKMTKDSAQHLLDRILPESSNISGSSIVYKKVCDEDPSQCRAQVLWGGSESIPAEDVQRLPQKKVLLHAEPDNPGTTFWAKKQKVTQGVLGMRYKAFDANGVYLYQGVWQGDLMSHGHAVLLRFENGQIAVFR